METVLTYLEEHDIVWGIVTNKPEQFSIPLIQHLQLDRRAACLISGDTLSKRKPHPEPILHACQLLHVEPAHTIYLGDSEVDMIASHAAGSLSCVAMYGYIPHTEHPLNWHADGFIHAPIDMIEWMRNRIGRLQKVIEF